MLSLGTFGKFSAKNSDIASKTAFRSIIELAQTRTPPPHATWNPAPIESHRIGWPDLLHPMIFFNICKILTLLIFEHDLKWLIDGSSAARASPSFFARLSSSMIPAG